MNEKTRELNQARAENSHLAQQLGEEREGREQLEEHLAQQLGEERERREQLEGAASELRYTYLYTWRVILCGPCRTMMRMSGLCAGRSACPSDVRTSCGACCWPGAPV
jgi:hypothetical protein